MKKVNIGIVGLGRLGRHYAENIHHKTPEANLVAACSISADERQWAQVELNIPHVFESYTEMLAIEELDAVFVISSTNKHADHITEALEAGRHVFSEKPLALDVETCLKIECTASQFPHLFSVVGFVRRFDPSYVLARQKIDAGEIGKPFLVKSQTVDIDATALFQLEYVKTSGGLFHDMNVHDIDLARWFLDSDVKTVFATGGSFKHAGFAEAGDADNVLSTCVFNNGTMATLHASRTAQHGHDTFTEIVGTEGTLRIGRPASMTMLEISDKHGVRRECAQTFYDRFEHAFLLQAQDFIQCIQSNQHPKLTLSDATQATKTATALTQSFKTGKLVEV